MREYVILSIETHLFFTRIMKEHSLFLLASLPEKETDLKRRAECFRKGFEEGLKKTVRLADGMVGNAIFGFRRNCDGIYAEGRVSDEQADRYSCGYRDYGG